MRRSPANALFEPTEAEIQKEAYFLWLESGGLAGRDLDNWLVAEERLRRRCKPVRRVGGSVRRRILLSPVSVFPRSQLANN